MFAMGQEEDDDIVTLNPFEVDGSRDVGYYSPNAFSAYRMNIPLLELPVNVQVVTSEFIDDLKAINLEDVARYTPSVGLPVESNNNHDQGNFTVRGIGTARVKRNGFTRYYATDTTNIQRVEIVKGPASAMYGAAEPGGVINYVTKRPTAQPTGDYQFTVGSWDYYRGQVNVSGPIADQLLYRVDASYLDRKGYREFEWEERKFLSTVLQWDPSEAVMIRGDIELTDREFNPVARNVVWNPDAFARWQALPDEEKFANGTLRRVPTTEDGIRLWTEVAPHIPLTVNSAGPFSYNDTQVLVGTLESHVEFGENWTGRAMFSAGESEIDNLFASANRARVTGDGVSRSHRSNDNSNDTVNWQIDFAGDFDGEAMRHRVLLGVEYFEDEFSSLRFRDSPPSQLLYFLPSSEGILPIGADVLDYRLDPQDRQIGDSNATSENIGYFLSYQLTALEERLYVLGGIRQDTSEAFDAMGLPSRPDIEETSPQFGVNFKATDSLVLFANYAESFIPQGGLFRFLPPGGEREEDVETEPRLPQIGEGHEFGIKLDGLGGWISGTLSYFSIERNNVVAPLVIFPDGPSTPETSFRIDRYIAGEESDGFEASLLVQPMENWQILFGYSNLDATRNDPEAEGTFYEDFQRMVPGVPETQVTVWTKYKFKDALEGASVGGGYVYLDERRGGLTRDDFIILDSFGRVDLYASYAWDMGDSAKASLTLNVENLFDETYFRPGPIVEEPTNVKLTFKYSY